MNAACYAFIPTNRPGKRIVAVIAGERGYSMTSRDAPFVPEDKARAYVDDLNAALGVKPEEAAALLAAATQERPAEPGN